MAYSLQSPVGVLVEIVGGGEDRRVYAQNLESGVIRADARLEVRVRSGRGGQWKTSQSFSRNEIPLAIYLLQKAFKAMIEKRPETEDAEHPELP